MQKIRKPILVPLAIVMLLLLGVTIFNAHNSMNLQFNREMRTYIDGAKKIYENALAKDAEEMAGLLDFLERDDTLQKNWLAKNREALLDYSSPIFHDLKNKYRVTHFYFHQLDKTNFLRVHQPPRHGDLINRFTLQEAAKNQLTSWGIELGPLGTFTLRVVRPWIIDGQLAGYLELGEEITHISRQMKEALGIEVISIIEKDHLDRQRWEEGVRMLGNTSTWDRFSDFVVSDETLAIPNALDKYLVQHSISHEQFLFDFFLNDKRYAGGFLPSYDAWGREVGELIVLRDVSTQKAVLQKLWVRQGLIFLVLGTGLYILFWIYLNRLAGLLQNQHQALEAKITEHQKSELALRESEERYRDLFENAHDLIQIIQPDGRLLYVNRSWRERMGYDRKTIADLTLNDILAAEQVTNFNKIVENVKASGQLKEIKTIFIAKDGRPVSVEGSATCKFNDNTPASIRFILRDVTEQENLEKQLYQSQRIQAIGTLAGGIAHDFNNILTAIIGYAEFLEQDIPRDTEAWSNLQEVIKAGNRAKELVKQILTFSRQTEQELRPTQVNLLVKEVLKLMRSSLPTTITIRQNIGSEYGSVMADPSQIHQVVMNLCNNAYHAMQEKGGELRVGLYPKELTLKDQTTHDAMPPGNYLVLEVSDTGHGMDQATMERIFEPYFTTKERGRGTGLGLSLVHGIVKKHHGQITVHSEPGKGATFQVYLPLIKSQDDPTLSEAVEITPRGTERIMVLDDEVAIAHFEELMLKSLGYRVETFSDSLLCLESFRNAPDSFDLVITDMTMPGMTGAELARHILEIRPGLPIIICTGFSEVINEETAKSIGIRELVMKPMLRNQMAKVIRKVLDSPAENS